MAHDMKAPRDSLLGLSMSGYKVPKGERNSIPIKNITSMKSDLSRKTLIAEQAQKAKNLPSCSTYKSTQHWNWSAKKNAWRPAGKFLGAPKVSFTAETMKK